MADAPGVTVHPMAGQRGHQRHTGRLVVSAFGLFIALGTMLLWLPLAVQEGHSRLSLVDAFFTASSAVTVTGLVVLDTGAVFSRFGQVVIMALIQVGGLGIMTLASVMSVFLSRKLGINRGRLAGAEIGVADLGELRTVMRALVRFSFASEVLVACLLSIRFMLENERSVGESLFLGVFHAISAFNNAGFSVLEGGLERYVTDWYMNLVIAGAFIAGGLGFPVVLELVRRDVKPSGWTLHTRVTLLATSALLAAGTAALLAVEWNNQATLGPLSWANKMLAAFFQSATARTAGFNTIDLGQLRTGSVLVMVLLMVIGASSASTGGGIKTSTFAIVVWTTLAEFRGDPEVTIHKRRIGRSLQRQALALVIAALGTVGTATFLLAILMPEVDLADLLFEAASAFGTAGVTRGVTSLLDIWGKLLIVTIMFIGRVGPITFGAAILLRSNARRFRYPEEKLLVG